MEALPIQKLEGFPRRRRRPPRRSLGVDHSFQRKGRLTSPPSAVGPLRGPQKFKIFSEEKITWEMI